MNLEKLNLKELSVEEARNIEGGKKWSFSITLFGYLIFGYDSETGISSDLWD
jgi:hypothetical protein